MASIIAFVGLGGGGKNYSACEFLLPAFKAGRKVITNVEFYDDIVKRDFPTADIEYIDIATYDFSNPVCGAVYLLDEIYLRHSWRSGVKVTEIPDSDLILFKKFRHFVDSDTGYGIDIIITVQTLKDIASALRSMIETTILCSKLLDAGRTDCFRQDYVQGCYEGTSINVPKSIFLNTVSPIKYKSSIYQYYKSQTHSTGGAGDLKINESRFHNRAFYKQPKFLLVLACFLILVFSSIHDYLKGSNPVLNSSQASKKSDLAVSKPVSVSPVNEQLKVKNEPVKFAPVPIVFSVHWRLVGSFDFGSNPGHKKKGRYFLARSSTGREESIPASYCSGKLEIVCKIDGEVITYNSGSSSSAPALSGDNFLKSSINI